MGGSGIAPVALSGAPTSGCSCSLHLSVEASSGVEDSSGKVGVSGAPCGAALVFVISLVFCSCGAKVAF